MSFGTIGELVFSCTSIVTAARRRAVNARWRGRGRGRVGARARGRAPLLLLQCINQLLLLRVASTVIASPRHRRDASSTDVAVPVSHRPTEPARPRHCRGMTLRTRGRELWPAVHPTH